MIIHFKNYNTVFNARSGHAHSALVALAAEAPGRDEGFHTAPDGVSEWVFGFRFFVFYNKRPPPAGNTRRHNRAAASAGDARTPAAPAGLSGKGD
jgi:hypothetical protein